MMKKKGAKKKGKVGAPKPTLEDTKTMKDHPVGSKVPGGAKASGKTTHGKGMGKPFKKKK